MRLSSPLRLLLALAFVIGQCLALAHATSHELAAGDSHSCETCAIAHAAGAAPSAPAFVCAQIPVCTIGAVELPTAPQLRRTVRLRSRAPPISL